MGMAGVGWGGRIGNLGSDLILKRRKRRTISSPARGGGRIGKLGSDLTLKRRKTKTVSPRSGLKKQAKTMVSYIYGPEHQTLNQL